MQFHLRSLRIYAVVALASLVLGARCGTPPRPIIQCVESVETSPDCVGPPNGIFTTGTDIILRGQVVGTLTAVTDLRLTVLNAAGDEFSFSILAAMQTDGSFAIIVPIDPAAKFHPNHPMTVEVVRDSGRAVRDRITVISGQSIADGDFTPQGVALRLNDSGLDQAEPLVAGAATFDLPALLPPGTLVTQISSICDYDVRVASYWQNPATGPASIDIDSQSDSVRGDIDFYFHGMSLSVTTPDWWCSNCTATVDPTWVEINGLYDLRPDPFVSNRIDVEQLGGISLGNTSFNVDISGFTCDLAEFFGLIGDDLGGEIESALGSYLNDPDGPDNPPGSHPQDGPIADAFEDALDGIEISGPIGQAIGVNLETPIFDIFEDTVGITFDSDVRITASAPDPNAVDLAASYHVPAAFPSFGGSTPGGSPYDLAICISTSGFNQLLKAEIESGLLMASITELDLGFGPTPLTAGLMTLLIPEFSLIDPAMPLRIDVAPALAPVVSGPEVPGEKITDLRISHLVMGMYTDDGNNNLVLEIAIDAIVGLQISFGDGALTFGLGDVLASNLNTTILQNTLGTDELFLQNLLLNLLPLLLPSLADSLGTFPLPDFLGLQLDLVEVSRNGEFMSLFVDLNTAP
jgi:hypothetical protein